MLEGCEPRSVKEILSLAAVGAEAQQHHLEKNKQESEEIETSIQETQDLLQLLSRMNFNQIAEALQATATNLRIKADKLHAHLLPLVTLDKGNERHYIRHGIPQMRAEAEIFDQLAKLLLIEGLPNW